jgi:Ca-activated chloride channel homolog
MKFLISIAFLLLCSCFETFAQQVNSDSNPQGTIRVHVDRINVEVTITDSHHHSVNGLRREDFRIFDNGREQPISGFVPNEEPARIVFLIEGSTADFLLAKLGKSPFLGADNLLNNIAAVDRVAVIMYSDSARMLLDFTSDKQLAREVLQGVNSQVLSLQSRVFSGWLNLSTSLISTLNWLESISGSKVIVLLSTGVDTSPSEALTAIHEKLRTSDVRLLALSMLGDFRKPAKQKRLSSEEKTDRRILKSDMSQSDELLRELAESTGGHAYFPKDRKSFEHAYVEMAQLVRGEYTVEFAPPEFDGKVHNIQVRVKHFGYHIDCRTAYIAPQEP